MLTLRPDTTQDFRSAYCLYAVDPGRAPGVASNAPPNRGHLPIFPEPGGSGYTVWCGNPNYPFILVSLKRASPSSEAERIPDSELNERIDRELSSSEYSWRKPQHHLVSGKKSWLQGLGTWVAKSFAKVSRVINRLVDAIAKWWRSLFPNPEGATPLKATAPNWINQLLLYAIICSLIVAVVLILLRLLGLSKKRKPVPVGPLILATPNLEKDKTAAHYRPDDQWNVRA